MNVIEKCEPMFGKAEYKKRLKIQHQLMCSPRVYTETYIHTPTFQF